MNRILWELLGECAFEERLTIDVFLGLDDVELTIIKGFSDVNSFGEVVVFLACYLAVGTYKADAGFKCLHDLYRIKALGFFNSGFPKVNTIVRKGHWGTCYTLVLDDAGNRGLC